MSEQEQNCADPAERTVTVLSHQDAASNAAHGTFHADEAVTTLDSDVSLHEMVLCKKRQLNSVVRLSRSQ
jgi:hypothetical protein